MMDLRYFARSPSTALIMSKILNDMRPRLTASLFRTRLQARLMSTDSTQSPKVTTPVSINEQSAKPVKFTTSEAYLNYRSTDNFYGGDSRDLPKSHNYFLAGSGILGIYYLIFLRDDIDADGGAGLFKPLHETVPQLAIPLIQSAIAENKKFGYSTAKLEQKLSELMKEPEKYGGVKNKLVEN